MNGDIIPNLKEIIGLEENEITPETKEDFEALAEKIIDSLMGCNIIYRWEYYGSKLIIEKPSEFNIVPKDTDRQTYNSVAKNIIEQIIKGNCKYRWENDFKRLIIEQILLQSPENDTKPI